jgi:hypothetical protein
MSTDTPHPPQVENETLGIDDTQKGTRGGPPMWIAMTIIGGLFLVAAVVVLVMMLGS